MDTKDFDVIRIARSDGADTGPGYWPVTTTTTTTTAPAANAAKKPGKEAAAAADKTPRTKPQMTRLAEDDPRFVEWRIKLGILLKQELSPNPDGELIAQAKRAVMPAERSLIVDFMQREIRGMSTSHEDTGYTRNPSISGFLDTLPSQSYSRAHRSSAFT